MPFNESNTVEAYVRDILAGQFQPAPSYTIRDMPPDYGLNSKGIGWHYVAPSEVPRQIQEVLVEPWLREALIRANEEMTAWMRGERSMPFGPNHASKGTEVGYNAPDSSLERTPLSHAGGGGGRGPRRHTFNSEEIHPC